MTFRRFFALVAVSLFAGANVEAWQMLTPPLSTPWTALVNTNNPLPEYPRPQLVRSNWLSLNGIWQFEPGVTNTDAPPTNQTLSGSILVPYPMESAVSGVMQYHAWSWYRTLFGVPSGWGAQRVILHFDAVTWQAQVFVNGHSVGVHKGGYDPFSFDITPYLSVAKVQQELIVQVFSPQDNGSQPRGKQTLYPGGIMYTASSGIWQPVWLEPVSSGGVQNLVISPDIDNQRVFLTVNTSSTNPVTISATVLSNATPIQTASGKADTRMEIGIPNVQLWSPDTPFLYNLAVTVTQGGTNVDSVTSYFGMRKIAVAISNGIPWILLNNQSIFQMGPLDQGFWPDGIYTAPTDAALAFDIQETKALGFNTIRKHEKVERQRWYYWADKLGMLVWQDMPTCNSYTGNPNPPVIDPVQFIAELSALVTNHWNSPSIIMWDVFNEGQGEQGSGDGVGQTNTAYLMGLVEGLDPSRLVNEASGGNYYGAGNVFDNHSYPAPGDPTSTNEAAVDGEFGGIGLLVPGHLWNPAAASVGYINAGTASAIAPTYDSFIEDLVGYKPGGLNAAIYTQITDVENECDGLLTYDRIVKPDPTPILISNEKAITGSLSVTTLVPDSENESAIWNYTTDTSTASGNWYATNFNASSWSSGPAPFGQGDPGVVTSWTTDDIWIRRWFSLGPVTPADLNDLAFNVYHDEDCQIYLNGVLAATATGYVTSYVWLPANDAAKAALVQNGSNLIAIHCSQTTGGQEIDAGLGAPNFVGNIFSMPRDYVNYWPLDATSGTVAADVSGSGDNGTVVGASWNPAGKVNGCLSFNGVNNYVQVGRDMSNDFSIAFWVKTTNGGNAGLVDGSAAPGSADFGTSLAGGVFSFRTGVTEETLYSTTAINDGAWHHCVATRTQATGLMQVYVDGILQASGTGTTNTLSAVANLDFGRVETGGGYFSGSLDEIKIYGRALGGLEIAALYADSAATLGAPTNLTAATANSLVTLNWWSIPVASSYDVSRATSASGPFTVITNVSTPGFTDTNVVNGTVYYYEVASVDSAGVGTNSSEVRALPSTLNAWFVADSITGLANGANVARWPDLSGNGNDATQTGVGNRPGYNGNAMNGHAVVRFSASSSTYMTFNRPVQDDFTIIILYQSSQNTQGTSTAFYNGAGLVNGDQPNVQADFGAQLNSLGQICVGTGQPDTSIHSGTGFNDGRPHVVTFERTESTGALALYVDGTEVATGTGGTESLTAPPTLDLGAIPSGGDYLNGDLAEVRLYSEVLGTEAREAVETALRINYAKLALPALGVGAASGNGLTLSWPAIPGFNLYSATNLTPPVAWSIVTNTPTTVNGTNTLVLNTTGAATFFELIAQ